jgi:hypothetical protein
MTRRQGRGVAAVSVALMLVALWLRLASPSVSLPTLEQPQAVFAAETPSLGAETVDPAAYLNVIEGNILSPSREAPAAQPASSANGTPLPRPVRRLRLSGIVRGPDGIVALIDADPATPGAELYRLGDQVGAYRLEEATDSVVVLRGPSGTQVLRLDPGPGRVP